MNNEMPTREEFLAVFKEHLAEVMPSADSVRDAIAESMPYPSQILQVIGQAVEEYMRSNRKNKSAQGF